MIKVIHVISDTNIGGAGTVLLTTLYNIDQGRRGQIARLCRDP